MSELYEIKINRVVPGPDSYFVSARHPAKETEFHFIVRNDGSVHGRSGRHEKWVELSEPTKRLVQEKLRQFVSEMQFE